MGPYKYLVMAQGVCSASDIFNFLTDGSMRYDGSEAIKNMDDTLLHGQTLEELEEKLKVFMKYCETKNLKLKPSKIVISEEVEFAGTAIRAEKKHDNDVVHILPMEKRVQAFMELKKPKTKKELQVWCGMVSSLQKWYPSLPLNLTMLRKSTVGKGKIDWTEEHEAEYQNAMKVMQTRIMLSPYDPKKRLCLITDGAKTIGTGFVLCQYVNENNPSQGVNIIHSGARKFDSGRIYSPVEAEDIALKQAISECHHLIYYADPVMLFSDCSGLLDMIKKPLADIENVKIRKILEKAQNYHWETQHIPAEENEICDAFSRLCTQVCFDGHNYDTPKPRILKMSKVAKVRRQQMEKMDPLVQRIAEEANLDSEYVEMLNYIEADVDFKDIDSNSELKLLKDDLHHMSIITLD